MLEQGVSGVTVTLAVTIVMVVNLPGDSTEGGVLVITGGVMMMRVIVSQQRLRLLQLVMSSVKPALLQTQHRLFQSQDHEEAETENQIGDGVVDLNIILVPQIFEDFLHLFIGLGKKIQETGANEDSSTETRAVAQN